MLVGRGELLERAQGVLERARAGAGSVLLVSGEAGVGKSRLLRSTLEAARSAGFLVLQGACTETERSDPYAPLADLVRGFATGTSAAVAAHAFAAAAPELLALFPELHALFPEATPPSARDPEQDRRRLFQALSSTLRELSETQPLLVIFEDVHWSDDATLDLVLHLARGLATQRTVLALTYRSDEVGPRLARLLAELDRTRLTTELELRPLSAEDVVAMLHAIFGHAGVPGEGFVATLHELTEGNPFFVEEVLKALVTAGELARGDDGAWRAPAMDRVRVPRTAVEAVRRRLSGLSSSAREVAAVAA
ncbi:MAG TPA: AAA family ATPase, partial [Longimicrobiales bacterium]